jgi:hypothetical protein
MASSKERRVANAVGFIAGVLACLNALRDAKVLWPPDAAWAQLTYAHRLEFGIGMALILGTLITSNTRRPQS